MVHPLRMAIAGPGFIGRVHARAIAKTDGCTVRAVLGTNRERAESFRAEFGADRAYTDAGSLARDPEIDAVVIATPNRDHVPLAIALMESGKHVLVEKPMAMNAPEAARAAETARRTGRRLMVGHMWRFDRDALLLRDAVKQGVFGEIVKTKGYGVHVHWGPSGWFTDPQRAGGGALIDMGVHAIDTVRFLLGDPEPTRVYARIGTHYGEYAVDDAGILVVTWSNGTESIIESGWWNPHMDGPEASTQLFGTRGYGRLFPTEIRRTVDGKPVTEALEIQPRSEHCDPHMFEGQIAELCAAIREERDPVPGAEHGSVVMRICDAAYQSARENRQVELVPSPAATGGREDP